MVDKDGFETVVHGHGSGRGRTATLDAEVTRGADALYTARAAFDPFNPLRQRLASSVAGAGLPTRALRPIDNFYRFQMRQRRATELDDLKRRFQEDQARLQQLKKHRIF